MCGIIAAFSESESIKEGVDKGLYQMRFRGPDANKIWRGEGVCLGHTRLAIIDLDIRASLPMHSACGRYTLIYNGEVYNYQQLRQDLEMQGVEFLTQSDSEVILELFARKGEKMLSLLRGMFAIVIWDAYAKRGFVARDPYGIKPLYFAKAEKDLFFASQVKALLATGIVSNEEDRIGQAQFWMLGSIPEPYTWYESIKAFPAGHYGWIEKQELREVSCWNDIGGVWRSAAQDRSVMDKEEVGERVRKALHETIKAHLVSDVPVGVFLSGGVDSGALAGMMVEHGREVQGITLSYDEYQGKHEDESPVAGKIARQYGIRHHIRRVTQEEFVNDFPSIMESMDQPSIDGINTWYASKAVAELGLKVVVSGVGGDELFQGYPSFTQIPKAVHYRKTMSRIPGGDCLIWLLMQVQARRTGNARWRHASKWLSSLEGAWWLRRSLYAPSELTDLMGEEWTAIKEEDWDIRAWVREMTGELSDDPVLAVGQMESMIYMKNQLLRDSDWASMRHGVELRTPLVDAWLLQELKPCMRWLTDFPGKTLLGKAPSLPLTNEVIQRRKTGFGIPIAKWLDQGDSILNGVGSRKWAKELIKSFSSTD